MQSPERELDRFMDRKAGVFALALLNIARFQFDLKRKALAERDLRELIAHTMILADLHGRRRGWMEYDHALRSMRAKFTALPGTTPIVPRVPFEEAIERIVNAEPRLAQTAEQVSRFYSESPNVFAMARSASMNVTERVQKAIGVWMREGKSPSEIENIVLNIGKSAEAGEVRGWTRAYAGTVYRTNASSAYSYGRFQAAQSSDLADVVKALMVVGISDDRERLNHRVARGLIADPKDPVWQKWLPPFGYSCRHGIRYVSQFELERMGRIRNGILVPYYPPGLDRASPDEGFGVKTFVTAGVA